MAKNHPVNFYTLLGPETSLRNPALKMHLKSWDEDETGTRTRRGRGRMVLKFWDKDRTRTSRPQFFGDEDGTRTSGPQNFWDEDRTRTSYFRSSYGGLITRFDQL